MKKHYQHGLGKDVVLSSAPPNGCRDAEHPTWRIGIREVFQLGSGGWEAEVCTPPGVLLIYFGGLTMVVLNVSSHMYDFYCGSDCM